MQIGDYSNGRELGEGTSGESFLVEDKNGRQLVLKKLLDRLASQEEPRSKFLNAIRSSSDIQMMKQLAAVTGHFTFEGAIYLVRQFIEGQPLSDIIREGNLAQLNIRHVASSLCSAVRAMHRADVVHGGIHPANVIVKPDGYAVITDFGTGLAVITKGTDSSYPLDAFRYLAPESVGGEAVGAQSDIYAIGLIVATIEKNGHVLNAPDWTSLKKQILDGYRSDCPVIAAAVDLDPDRRYRSIDTFRDKLAAKYAGNDEDGPKPPVPLELHAKAVSFDAIKLTWTNNLEGAKTIVQRKTANENWKQIAELPADDSSHVDKNYTPDTRYSYRVRSSALGASPPWSKHVEEKTPPKADVDHEDTVVGKLTVAIHEESRRNLLEHAPPELWEIQSPTAVEQHALLLQNGGSGMLNLELGCEGDGIAVSPRKVDISPGQYSSMIISVDQTLKEFSAVVFKWKENRTPQVVQLRLHRSD